MSLSSDVSKHRDAFLFRVKSPTLFGLLHPEHEGTAMLRNVGNCLLFETV